MADRDELGEVREDVATIKETLRWHKWLLFALVAAVLSPKLGGPAASDLVTSLLTFA